MALIFQLEKRLTELEAVLKKRDERINTLNIRVTGAGGWAIVKQQAQERRQQQKKPGAEKADSDSPTSDGDDDESPEDYEPPQFSPEVTDMFYTCHEKPWRRYMFIK